MDRRMAAELDRYITGNYGMDQDRYEITENLVIKTSHEYPPIPIRNLDWCAWVDGTEGEDMIQGWGPTEQTAIANLMDRLEEAN